MKSDQLFCKHQYLKVYDDETGKLWHMKRCLKCGKLVRSGSK